MNPRTIVELVQHRPPLLRASDLVEDAVRRLLDCDLPALPVVDADDKQAIEPGTVYLAPPDYHLYVEADGFALSVDDAVLYSRPSIDVLFESAADVYRERLIAVVLTGANEDGAHGISMVKQLGGYTIVQEPSTAERREMPDAAIASGAADHVLPLESIASKLMELA